MGSAWEVGATDCDLSILPDVELVPRLPDHAETVLRLAAMGVLSDSRLQEALISAPRTPHALPQPHLDLVELEGASLRLPFWHDVDARSPLLPSHYETIQVLQLLRVKSGNSILLVGPRGNWWTEILVRLGAGEVRVIEPDCQRRVALERSWEAGDCGQLATDLGCSVTWGGLVELADIALSEDDEWDRILLTSSLPNLPVDLLRKLPKDGCGLVVIGTDEAPVIQLVTRAGKRELAAQWITCWSVDQFEPIVSEVIEGMDPPDDFNEVVEIDEAAILRAWTYANCDPLRDRFAPERSLQLIEEIWDSMAPFHPDDDGSDDIRARLSNDLFRMGHVLQQLGVFNLAVEHHSESFRMMQSAEAATFLGWALGQSGDTQASLAWCKKAIEVDPTLGNPWNDIGAILLTDGEPREAVPWLRAATEAPRYEAVGFPWLNLAKVHEKLGNKMAAFEAARQALEHLPEDLEAARIFDEFAEGLL